MSNGDAAQLIGVHVVAAPGLAGAPMPAATRGDPAVSVGGQKDHLVFKDIRRQRPAVAEGDGPPLAPIVVIDLRSILGLERRHFASPSSLWARSAALVCAVLLRHLRLRPRS